MSYTPITDFSAKDALTTGTPAKLLTGAEFDAEFDAISTDLALKSTASKTETLTNKSITNPTITNYVEVIYTPSAGSAFTIDLANGTIQKLTTNANVTITLPASVAGKSYLLMVVYGGTHTVTWAGGSTIKWPGATAPTATSVNTKIDLFSFVCDGTNTYGRSGGSNF
jgi:hypothetical protein